MRPRRILAVAWRDIRLVSGGQGWWKLPALALALLLPVGVIPMDLPTDLEQLPARAQGAIPAPLRSLIQPSPRAPVRFVGDAPITLRATRIPPATRRALDTLPGPRVQVHDLSEPLELPGRSLLVALLALSLLTGPLAESLAGERARGTLSSLLTAGISRAELARGKWLAWTAAASGATLLVAISGVLSGSQEVGVWPLGLPMVAGCAVALGLWLGRSAADEVGSATRTMRVLPMAALMLGGLAWFLRDVHPALGALVPLGGPLLLSGNLATSAPEIATAALSTTLSVGALLWSITRSLEGEPSLLDLPGLMRTLTVIAAAALCWWLPVVGPGIWGVAGNPGLSKALDPGTGQATGAALLLTIMAVQSSRLDKHTPLQGPSGPGLLIGAGLGVVLGAVAWSLPSWTWAQSPLALVAQRRLDQALLPPGLAALLVLPAHELLFRGWLQRASLPLSLAAWVLICCPTDPLLGVLSGVALAALSQRYGWWSSLGARVVWLLTALLLA